MRIGGSMFLIARGAILTFATHVQTAGFSLHATGVILMIVGTAAAALTLIAWNRRSKTVTRRDPSAKIVEQRTVQMTPRPRETPDPTRLPFRRVHTLERPRSTYRPPPGRPASNPPHYNTRPKA